MTGLGESVDKLVADPAPIEVGPTRIRIGGALLDGMSSGRTIMHLAPATLDGPGAAFSAGPVPIPGLPAALRNVGDLRAVLDRAGVRLTISIRRASRLPVPLVTIASATPTGGRASPAADAITDR